MGHGARVHSLLDVLQQREMWMRPRPDRGRGCDDLPGQRRARQAPRRVGGESPAPAHPRGALLKGDEARWHTRHNGKWHARCRVGTATLADMATHGQSAGVDDLLRRIEERGSDILRDAEGLRDELLYKQPDEEGWSVMRVLGHVAELLPYWTTQAVAVAGRTTPGQPFGRTHDDPARLAAVEDHAHDALGDVLPRVRESLRVTMDGLRSISPEGWTRSGKHARRGEMTVRDIVEQFIADHLDEHAAQAREALARAAA